MRPSRCYLLKCRGDVSASQSDTMKETKEHRSCVTVTHQTNQVHLASRQETGTYKAKTMKSAAVWENSPDPLPVASLSLPLSWPWCWPLGATTGQPEGSCAEMICSLLWLPAVLATSATCTANASPQRSHGWPISWAGKVSPTSQTAVCSW